MKTNELNYEDLRENKTVYLFGSDEGFFKIGVSSNPERHRMYLQRGLPFVLKAIREVHLKDSQHAFMIAEALQIFCRAQRTRGDWFKDINVKAVVTRMESEAAYYNADS